MQSSKSLLKSKRRASGKPPAALSIGPRGFWPMADDGVTPVVTQSMVSAFTDCPREVYYGTVLGLRPRLEAKPLTRGTWIHSLLEERANGRDWVEKHNEIYAGFEDDPYIDDLDALEEEVYNIVKSYDWVYRNDDWTVIAAEITVERPIFHGAALYRGRIDLIIMDENGDVWLVDHKTHRTFPEWQYRELSFQHYSYMWACRKAPEYLAIRHNGKPVPQPKGFIYDYCKTGAIGTPQLTKKTRKISRQLKPSGTTLPVFTDWLRDQGMLTTVRGKDLLAIEDSDERQYVEEFIIELENKDYTSHFRRDKMVFSQAQQTRQLKSFLSSARRMLKYTWDDPDTIERGSHAGYKCRYQDLSVADLMHGTSEIEQRTRYVVTHDPLDYYPNQDKDKKKGVKK